MTPEMRELLSRHIDGDLDPGEEGTVRAALRRPEVAAELERMRRLRAAVRRLARRESPPPVLDRLVEPLRLTPPPRPVWRTPAALAAAAALVAAAGLVAVLPRAPERERTAPPRAAAAPSGRPAPFVLGQTPRLEGAGSGPADRLAAARPEVPQPAGEPQPMEIAGPLEPGGAVLRLGTAEVPLPAAPAVGAPQPVEVEVRGGRVVEVRQAPEALTPALEGLEVPGTADGVRRGTVEPVSPGRSASGTGGR